MTRFTTRAAACIVALAGACAALAQDADPATPVATVNGETVTLGDLIAVRGELPAQVQGLPDEVLYDGIRRQLVDSKIVEQAAEAEGIAGEPSVQRALDRQRAGMLADLYLGRVIEREVTEEAVRARYQSEYADAEPQREIRASHILVDSEEAAQALHDQLEDGADFAELAAKHGTDGTRTQGGDLGFFTRERMVAPFAEAAFNAEIGENVGPVQTQFGWHVLRVTEERDVPVPPFEQVRGDIVQALSQEVAESVLADLREGAEISMDEERPGLDALRNDGLIE